SSEELGPLPDDILTNPDAARLDPRGWFDEPERRFELEIGSGKGTFLLQQAELEPETNFLGIEWAHEFYRYAADRVRRRREAGKLLNVRLLGADAAEFLRWRCPDAICSVIHLYFSDPWPKKKHHKKRVVQHGFLADAWRILEPGGELRVVTDHAELWAWDELHFEPWTTKGAERVPEMKGLPDPPFDRKPFERPASAGEGEIVGTNYERKFRVEGRSFNSCTLVKRVTE
ncbi:MAG: hypothetical protein AAGI17_11560, partial [Planctomycetota bacterium]